jgi:hypothetical protein
MLSLVVIQANAGSSCPLQGDATDAKRMGTNKMKNRSSAPGDAAFDSSISIFKMLNSEDADDAFDENKAATITGYMFGAKSEGPESCNCHSKDAADHDIHVYIAPSLNTSSIAECVVVEVTPWVKKVHPEWTTAYLNSLKGHRVTIGGWLLYDWEHLGQSTAMHPDGAHNIRGTVWEIHPITNIEDLDEDADAGMKIASSPESFAEKAITPESTPVPGGTLPPALAKTPGEMLAILIIGAFLGMVGQGFRVIVGLKKLNDISANKAEFDAQFDPKQLMISLLYAMAIGALTGVIVILNGGLTSYTDAKSLIAIIAAGYAGTDLIEGFVTKNLK